MTDAMPQVVELRLGNREIEHEQRGRDREHAIAKRFGPARVPSPAQSQPVRSAAARPARMRRSIVCSAAAPRTVSGPGAFAQRLRLDERAQPSDKTESRTIQLHFELVASTKLLTE